MNIACDQRIYNEAPISKLYKCFALQLKPTEKQDSTSFFITRKSRKIQPTAVTFAIQKSCAIIDRGRTITV